MIIISTKEKTSQSVSAAMAKALTKAVEQAEEANLKIVSHSTTFMCIEPENYMLSTQYVGYANIICKEKKGKKND